MLGGLKQSRRLPPDYNIIKRRANELARSELLASKAQNEHYGNRAHWEIRSGERMLHTQASRRVEEMREEEAKRLAQRRDRLATLFREEAEQFRKEYEEGFETPEQTKQRMAESKQTVLI